MPGQLKAINSRLRNRNCHRTYVGSQGGKRFHRDLVKAIRKRHRIRE